MDITQLGSDLEKFDFEYLMDRALSNVSDEFDTRETSVIYTLLAPACYELAMMYMELKQFYQSVFIQSAYDNYLDLKVAEQGLVRQSATRSVKLGRFNNTDNEPMSVPVGARFATIHPTDSLVYTVIRNRGEIGEYELQCDVVGTIGDHYVGDLLPVDHINGLGTATMSTLLTPGQNTETDDSLRSRFFNAINVRSGGGNIAQYKQETNSIDGVGATQVYPVWDGGGTVKVVILSDGYDLVSDEFINDVQNHIDPRKEGLGLGLAPIGHKVNVTTPTRKDVAIEVNVILTGDVGINIVNAEIKTALEDYFSTMRQNWDKADDLGRYRTTVFSAQIVARLINILGVGNVTGVMITGSNEYGDLELTQTGQLQELPYLGEVIINAN